MGDLFCANCLVLGANSPKAVTIYDGRAMCFECLHRAKGGGVREPRIVPGGGDPPYVGGVGGTRTVTTAVGAGGGAGGTWGASGGGSGGARSISVMATGGGGGGGYVITGGKYIVGEQGPEVVVPFPPHNPDFPDVNPATGDERETTEGPAKD